MSIPPTAHPLPVLQLHNISVQLEQAWILRKISCCIQPGEFVSILGPNGAGKSTLLKTLLGFHTPEQGHITLLGKPWTQYKPRERARYLAYVPQHSPVDEFCTVAEFVAFGRYPHHTLWQRHQTDRDHATITNAIEQTGLHAFMERTVCTLSGGERQRVLIASALAQEPHILLLDEPTTFLDPKSQVEIQQLLTHIHQQQTMSIIMVTHDMNAAIQNSTRLIGLQAGRLLFDLSRDNAWPSPEHLAAHLENLYHLPFQAIGADSLPTPWMVPLRPDKRPVLKSQNRLS